jgi:hypothetical protein
MERSNLQLHTNRIRRSRATTGRSLAYVRHDLFTTVRMPAASLARSKRRVFGTLKENRVSLCDKADA